MKHIPILFSTLMVQAILDGRKTQTRRVVKEAQGWDPVWKPTLISETHMDGIPRYEMRTGTQYSLPWFKCPYGQPGDVLWVRETYYAYGWWVKNGKTKTGKQKWKFIDFTVEDKDGKYHYEDSKPSTIENSRTEQKIGWYKRTSLFMPMEACRLFLKVKSVRVERLQDISEEDAKAEGIEFSKLRTFPDYKDYSVTDGKHHEVFRFLSALLSFQTLWQSINGPESWDANPWVWVVEFERTEKPANWPNQ